MSRIQNNELGAMVSMEESWKDVQNRLSVYVLFYSTHFLCVIGHFLEHIQDVERNLQKTEEVMTILLEKQLRLYAGNFFD